MFSYSSYDHPGKWVGPKEPTTASGWLQALPVVKDRLEKERTAVALRIDSLATPEPDVWSYMDFVYFSTIVQTTVGFGDILPNSTLVRMIVVGQILIGYALLVVVLNIVLGS